MPTESNTALLIAFKFQARKVHCFHNIKYINSQVHFKRQQWLDMELDN